MSHRKDSPAARRRAEHQRREEQAPRLSEQVPELKNLRIRIEERSGASSTSYTRLFVVATARALFLVPCGDPRCTDGGHDLTHSVMHALRTRAPSLHGSDECTGDLRSSVCLRVLQFDVVAEYAERPSRSTAPAPFGTGT
jgi:hypothetical protein